MKDYRSQALKEEDFDPRTLMIALNAQVKEKIIQQFEKAQNVYTLCEYIHSDEEVKNIFRNSLCKSGRYPLVFSGAMGNRYFMAKFKTLEEMKFFKEYVEQKKND